MHVHVIFKAKTDFLKILEKFLSHGGKVEDLSEKMVKKRMRYVLFVMFYSIWQIRQKKCLNSKK